MKLIQEILEFEIKAGYINWPKLEEKIHAALNFVDNKFQTVRKDGEVSQIKTRDSLVFHGNSLTGKKCYRLLKPRFEKGALYCDGLQIGTIDIKGQSCF